MLNWMITSATRSMSSLTTQTARNGYSTKTLKTEDGQFEIDTPRDRDGSFEPQLVKKQQTRFSLYG